MGKNRERLVFFYYVKVFDTSNPSTKLGPHKVVQVVVNQHHLRNNVCLGDPWQSHSDTFIKKNLFTVCLSLFLFSFLGTQNFFFLDKTSFCFFLTLSSLVSNSKNTRNFGVFVFKKTYKGRGNKKKERRGSFLVGMGLLKRGLRDYKWHSVVLPSMEIRGRNTKIRCPRAFAFCHLGSRYGSFADWCYCK